ncbi:MAG TPA: biopolymer transporter ExbD [Candidatus Krumholzibacteria bacterium]|nr:biopolymer transporter ExbD [Candidatus Krumholzibacteria bacterium]
MAKRNSGGMIIRLVDVVLIVLFGFLMISKIQEQVDIPLPQSKGDNPASTAQDEVFDVFIRADGRIQCGWIDSSYQVLMPLDNSDAGAARARYDELKGMIAKANTAKAPVSIQAEFDSPTQFTVDLLDICRDLGLQKSLTCFRLVNGQAVPAG